MPGDNSYTRYDRCDSSDKITPGEFIALFVYIALVKLHNAAPITIKP